MGWRQMRVAAGPTEKPPVRSSWRRQLLFARAPGTCCTIFLAAKCQCQIPLPVLPPKAVKAGIAPLIGDTLPVRYPKPEVNKDGEHLHIWKKGRGWMEDCPPGSKLLLPRQICCLSSCERQQIHGLLSASQESGDSSDPGLPRV